MCCYIALVLLLRCLLYCVGIRIAFYNAYCVVVLRCSSYCVVVLRCPSLLRCYFALDLLLRCYIALVLFMCCHMALVLLLRCFIVLVHLSCCYIDLDILLRCSSHCDAILLCWSLIALWYRYYHCFPHRVVKLGYFHNVLLHYCVPHIVMFCCSLSWNIALLFSLFCYIAIALLLSLFFVLLYYVSPLIVVLLRFSSHCVNNLYSSRE